MYKGLSDEEELRLTNYQGTRHEFYNDSGLVRVVDTRDLEFHKLACIKSLWVKCNEMVLKEVPEYTQRNIVMGLVDEPHKTIYLDKIEALKYAYDLAKTDIKAAESCDAIEDIVGNFEKLYL